MKIYAGKNKSKAEEITIGEVLFKLLREAGIDAKIGRFKDGSGGWVEIRQRSTKGNSRITIHIGMTGDFKTLTDISVWEARMIFDEDNEKRLT